MNSWENTGVNTLDRLPEIGRAVRVTMEGKRLPAAQAERNRKGRVNELTPMEVRAIKALHASGDYTLAKLAIEFGKSTTAIYYVVKGETYRDI